MLLDPLQCLHKRCLIVHNGCMVESARSSALISMMRKIQSASLTVHSQLIQQRWQGAMCHAFAVSRLFNKQIKFAIMCSRLVQSPQTSLLPELHLLKAGSMHKQQGPLPMQMPLTHSGQLAKESLPLPLELVCTLSETFLAIHMSSIQTITPVAIVI